ncbi:MAG: type IV pilin protein, partial [Gemmatimonadales bacterium]
MNSKGFTAIEMVIVVVLIGTIAAIGFPRIRDSIEKANRRAARTAV